MSLVASKHGRVEAWDALRGICFQHCSLLAGEGWPLLGGGLGVEACQHTLQHHVRLMAVSYFICSHKFLCPSFLPLITQPAIFTFMKYNLMNLHPLKQTPFPGSCSVGKGMYISSKLSVQTQFHQERITILVLMSTFFFSSLRALLQICGCWNIDCIR